MCWIAYDALSVQHIAMCLSIRTIHWKYDDNNYSDDLETFIRSLLIRTRLTLSVSLSVFHCMRLPLNSIVRWISIEIWFESIHFNKQTVPFVSYTVYNSSFNDFWACVYFHNLLFRYVFFCVLSSLYKYTKTEWKRACWTSFGTRLMG